MGLSLHGAGVPQRFQSTAAARLVCVTARTQWLADATRDIAAKHPNHEQKGRIGATFFLILCGFGLLFFGGGTLFVIYRAWIAPSAPSK